MNGNWLYALIDLLVPNFKYKIIKDLFMLWLEDPTTETKACMFNVAQGKWIKVEVKPTTRKFAKQFTSATDAKNLSRY